MSNSVIASLAGPVPITSTRIPVFEFVTDLCKKKHAAGETISGAELAKALNKAGFMTGSGTPYVEANFRGIFVVARFTWKWLTDNGFHSEAEIVAHTVVGSNGKPPWED
jgi:hypothetical protein